MYALLPPFFFFFFFFNDTATTEIYTLSLHDALPIWNPGSFRDSPARAGRRSDRWCGGIRHAATRHAAAAHIPAGGLAVALPSVRRRSAKWRRGGYSSGGWRCRRYPLWHTARASPAGFPDTWR